MKNQKAYLAEFIGSVLLVAAIVGSGTMGTQMSRDSGVGLTLNADVEMLVRFSQASGTWIGS